MKFKLYFILAVLIINTFGCKKSSTSEVNQLNSKVQNKKNDNTTIEQNSEYVSNEKTTILKLKRQGGIYEIPCKVNGLNINFYFDTGASDVTLSTTVAQNLFNRGLIKSSDIIGKNFYQVADGNISEGLILILREIIIGDIVLKNVKASIINSPEAPLLLGQTALEKLGKFSFDYSNNQLTIIGLKEFDFLKNNKLNQNLSKEYFNYKNEYLSDNGDIGKWIANEKIEIYKDAVSEQIIGYLDKNEKFYATESFYHYYKFAYARIDDVLPNNFSECELPPFNRGDLIYFLNREGEGVINVIHNDEVTYINCSFEPDNASLTRSLYDGCNNIIGTIINESEEYIYWVKIKKKNGEIGWIKNPNCNNVIGVRPNCYGNPSPAW